MGRLTLHNARANSAWFALAAALFMGSLALALTLLWPAGSQAFEGRTEVDLMAPFGDYSSPQHCRECHQAEFQAWADTTHADASFDPLFQVYLQQASEPGECFTCHATGYDTVTGEFMLAGVTCEACHGPYRADHPEESMKIATSEELCGTCHRGTLAEWQSSRHGKVGVTCLDCHEVHSQKARATENTNALCADCHADQIQDATHLIHNRSATGVYCVDCHLARTRDKVADMVKGQAVTGHSFAVLVDTCSNCHANTLKP